jgi:glutathione S-transferase
MYTLYFSPGTASFAVHWMLNEMAVPHELVPVDLDSKQQKSAEYMKLNPSGMVPTLVVDGMPRTECAALLLLLAERHPQVMLAPNTDSRERAEYLQWMFYFANTAQPAFRAWFYPHEPAGEGNVEAAKAQARHMIEAIWDRVNVQLAEKKFVIGNQLSAVDFFAAMLMRWSRNMPKPATAWPNIESYVRSMRDRPSYVQTHRIEKLADWLN